MVKKRLKTGRMSHDRDSPINPGTEPGLPATEDDLSPETIRRWLSRSPDQQRPFAAWLLKVVDHEIRFFLKPIAERYRRNLRDEAGDIAQDVMLLLFDGGGRVLRAWDPARGMKLRSFVALIVRRCIIRTFRGFRGNPWSSDPAAAAEITAILDDRITRGPTLLAEIEYRIQLEQILDGLRGKMNDRDWRLFTKLFVDQRKPAAVGDEEGMRENAVHQWKRRFVQRLVQMFGVLDHA